MPVSRILTVAAIVVPLSLSFPACKSEEKERAALREDLDTEFEAEMEQTMKLAETLTIQIGDLVDQHERNDRRHAELDELLAGVDLDEDDRAVQAKHAEWETRHRGLIDDAQHQVDRFEESRARHEAAEAEHADVALDQIREEHEQFERELTYFQGKLGEQATAMEQAQQEMSTIFADHDAMQAKHGK